MVALALLAACDSPRADPEDAAVRSDASPEPPDSGVADAAPQDASALDDAGTGVGYASLGLGYLHSCAVTTAGVARCWGSNFTGQVGHGVTGVALGSPGDVEELGEVVAVSGGEGHSCACSTTGAVRDAHARMRVRASCHLTDAGRTIGASEGSSPEPIRAFNRRIGA